MHCDRLCRQTQACVFALGYTQLRRLQVGFLEQSVLQQLLAKSCCPVSQADPCACKAFPDQVSFIPGRLCSCQGIRSMTCQLLSSLDVWQRPLPAMIKAKNHMQCAVSLTVIAEPLITCSWLMTVRSLRMCGLAMLCPFHSGQG